MRDPTPGHPTDRTCSRKSATPPSSSCHAARESEDDGLFSLFFGEDHSCILFMQDYLLSGLADCHDMSWNDEPAVTVCEGHWFLIWQQWRLWC